MTLYAKKNLKGQGKLRLPRRWGVATMDTTGGERSSSRAEKGYKSAGTGEKSWLRLGVLKGSKEQENRALPSIKNNIHRKT